MNQKDFNIEIDNCNYKGTLFILPTDRTPHFYTRTNNLDVIFDDEEEKYASPVYGYDEGNVYDLYEGTSFLPLIFDVRVEDVSVEEIIIQALDKIEETFKEDVENFHIHVVIYENRNNLMSLFFAKEKLSVVKECIVPDNYYEKIYDDLQSCTRSVQALTRFVVSI